MYNFIIDNEKEIASYAGIGLHLDCDKDVF